MKTITVIRQTDLQHLTDLEFKIEQAKREVAKLLAEHEDVEAPLMALLLGKATDVVVEPGKLTVAVDWSVKRSPSYKRWIELNVPDGAEVAARILDNTPESKTPYLVIADVATPERPALVLIQGGASSCERRGDDVDISQRVLEVL